MNIAEFEKVDDFCLTFPSAIAILGSSKAGKTSFLHRILTRLDEISNNYLPVSKLILCYNTYQTIYDEIIESMQKQFPGIEILTFSYYPEELFQDPSFFRVKAGTMGIVILDDIADQIKPSFENLLRKTVHHNNISVFFLSQDSSGDSNIVKKALRSVNYVVVMRSSQPGIFLNDISRKYLPFTKNFLHKCFELASRKKGIFYPYLIIDLNSIDNKIKNGIFREEQGIIYRP